MALSRGDAGATRRAPGRSRRTAGWPDPVSPSDARPGRRPIPGRQHPHAILDVMHPAAVRGDILDIVFHPARGHAALERHAGIMHRHAHLAAIDLGRIGQLLAYCLANPLVRAHIAFRASRRPSGERHGGAAGRGARARLGVATRERWRAPAMLMALVLPAGFAPRRRCIPAAPRAPARVCILLARILKIDIGLFIGQQRFVVMRQVLRGIAPERPLIALHPVGGTSHAP